MIQVPAVTHGAKTRMPCACMQNRRLHCNGTTLLRTTKPPAIKVSIDLYMNSEEEHAYTLT